MRVLVTGAAGLIGSATCCQLLSAEHDVIGLDNFSDYYSPALKEHRVSAFSHNPRFKLVRGSVENRELIDGVFARFSFDAVVNLAARAGVRTSIKIPIDYYQTNLVGTQVLLEAMREHGTTKLVQASTSSVYAGCDLPFHESHVVNQPRSPYAASKLAAEMSAYTYYHLHRISTTVVRYFTVYGPAGRPDMSPFRFIKWVRNGSPIRLFGDGSARRDFTFVDDIARGTIRALEIGGYEVINLGGDHPISMLDMIRLVENVTGSRATIEYEEPVSADMPETWADIGKARRLLGWSPSVGVAEGLARTARWHEVNADLERAIDENATG